MPNAAHPTGRWNEQTVPVVQSGGNPVIINPNSIAGAQSSITKGRVALGGQNPPGYINPINVRTTMQSMNIDSRFRKNYYNTSSSKFTVELPDMQRKVVTLRLASLELPLSHHAISAAQGNASMLLQVKDEGSDIYWRVRLPDGHYENSYSTQSQALSIEQAMNNAIALAEPGTLDPTTLKWTPNLPSPPGPIPDVVYSVDHASGRSTFAFARKLAGDGESATTPGHFVGAYFNVDHDGNVDDSVNIQQRLGWQLGFRAAHYQNKDPPTAEKPFACTSEAPCIITGPRYGFLAINAFQRNVGPSCVVAFGDSALRHNIIGRFSLATSVTDTGMYQMMCDSCLVNPTYTVREYFGPVNVQKLEFTLYDDMGNILDLNSCDWSCMLVFEKQYD